MINEKNSFLMIIKKLYPIIFRAAPVLFILFNITAIAHGVSFVIITIYTQKFFDSITNLLAEKTEITNVIIAGLLLGVAVVFSQLLNGFHNFMYTPVDTKIEGKLRFLIHQKISSLYPISFEEPETLDSINKAKNGMSNSTELVFQVTNIFTFYIPYCIFLSLYLFNLNKILAISLFLIFIPLLVTQFIRSITYSKLEDDIAPIRREYEYYEKCIYDKEYFKETRLLNATNYFISLYKDSLILLGKKIFRTEARTISFELCMRIITLLGYLGVLILLTKTLLAGDIGVGAFAAVFSSVSEMFGMIEEIVCRHIGDMSKNLGSVANFVNFLELPEKKQDDKLLRVSNGIHINDISFIYPGSNVNAISNITLDIKCGETVAIVGENGSGKTTLAKLIIGIFNPTIGNIYYDDCNIKNYSKNAVYSSITSVFQNYQKYKLSLEDNITISDLSYNNSNCSMLDEILKVTEINSLNDIYTEGLKTILSKEFGGIDISIGQWQKVAIARGLYKKHNIIVLDEPTSSIDPVEEVKTYEKFINLSKNKTAIIITHRLGSAKRADRIVVLEKGKIIEQGTHDTLLKNGQKYAKMFRAQAKWYS
ncbi:MAG: ABC transporter ATP-binding protein [Clostridia bacterium]|nr:ABC transporter ATP-binding protein [Clostridia bacterium]MDD3093109.1 ABC transporter ATP-binding protein [Clostridia bacterium]MDD3971845.1 ABC transporter ATP-binding protein [Clostridia bacterium]MDD4542325.1 ABC transporter ATP-binding protein [Clostridia bacterium]